MSIRDWSFSKLWAVTAGIWFLSLTVGEFLDYFDIGGLATFAVACMPAFLAGAWAGSHPEIARWPKVRLMAMWALSVAVLLGATEYVDHWRATAVILAAPVAVLSLRWYELTGGAPAWEQLPTPSGDEIIITPPPPGPRKRLPSS